MNQTNCEKHKRLEWNTYEKLTCWRMLKGNFCTFFFIVRVLCFVFLLFFPFQCPLFSLSCYFFLFGCFLLFFREEKRKDQSIPKYTKVPNPSKYTNIIQQTTPEIPEQNNNSSTLQFPVLRPGLGILGILGLLIFLGLRQCGPSPLMHLDGMIAALIFVNFWFSKNIQSNTTIQCYNPILQSNTTIQYYIPYNITII